MPYLQVRASLTHCGGAFPEIPPNRVKTYSIDRTQSSPGEEKHLMNPRPSGTPERCSDIAVMKVHPLHRTDLSVLQKIAIVGPERPQG